MQRRLREDAERAKREQLRRIEGVARERASRRGLASLAIDPDIWALSQRFSRMDEVVEQVRWRQASSTA